MSDEQRLVLLAGGGIFGLLLGSFLNVCIFRLPRQCMSVWKQTRSRCPKCRSMIAWYDNFPVVSWLVLGGKCRHCRKPISPRYMLVEILTGGLVAWITIAHLYPESYAASVTGYAPGSVFERGLVWGVQVYLTAVLLISTFIDFEFKILPDETNYSGLLAGLLLCAALPVTHLGGELWLGYPFREEMFPAREMMPAWLAAALAPALGAAAGAGSTHVVRVFGSLLYRQEAMGMGDVKLMGFLGAWLGWKAILLTFTFGCVFGSVYGLLQFPFTRKMRVEIWFGPFLALAALGFVLAGRGMLRVVDGFLDLTRAWADWMIHQGPAATVAFIALPFAILVWMLWRIWKRGSAPDEKDAKNEERGTKNE